MKHDFSFFASLEKPTTEAVKMVMAPGFGCLFQSSDLWRARGDEDMNKWLPVAWYLRALPKHPAGPFWLRFTTSGMEEDNPFKHLYSEPPHRTWQVEVGDIEIRDGEEWETPISGYSEFLNATFEFAPLRGFADDINLSAELKNGQLRLENPDLSGLDPHLRRTLAKGWFFMGAPLEAALDRTGTELNKHQELEWELERKEAVLAYLIKKARFGLMRFDTRRGVARLGQELLILKELLEERDKKLISLLDLAIESTLSHFDVIEATQAAEKLAAK